MGKSRKPRVLKSKSKLKQKVLKHKSVPLKKTLKKIGASKLKQIVSKGLSNLREENIVIEPPPINFVLRRRDVDEDQVRRGVNALFQYTTKKSSEKKRLFDDEQPIFLQIGCVKVANCPYRLVRFHLPHSILSKNNEICLIVKDIGKPKDHDETIEHYENILKEKGITNIKTVMPFHQFKTEYGTQFELKRKLLGLYDCFLVDGRLSGYVVHLLGNIFSNARKTPTPIKMDSSNLKSEIDKTLNKTMMKLHSKADSFTVQVGHTKMDEEQVYENALAIIDELSVQFPGGFDNVRMLGIKTDKSILVPVYLTLKNRSTVVVPQVKPKRPNNFNAVRDELTTYLDREITVLPGGKIITHDPKKKIKNGDEGIRFEESSDENDDDKDFSDIDDDDENDYNEVQDGQQVKNSTSDEEEEENDILGQNEAAYLSQYEEQVKTKKIEKTEQKKSKKSEKTEQNKSKKYQNKNDRKRKASISKMDTTTKETDSEISHKKVKRSKLATKSERKNVKSKKGMPNGNIQEKESVVKSGKTKKQKKVRTAKPALSKENEAKPVRSTRQRAVQTNSENNAIIAKIDKPNKKQTKKANTRSNKINKTATSKQKKIKKM